MPLGLPSNNLWWNPIGPALSRRLAEEGGLRLVIVPFIQSKTMTRFIADLNHDEDLKVVTRWRPEDITSGVSDIEVFKLLSEKGIKLYINNDIHLKLFVSGSNACFVGSANITEVGLGYSDGFNIEAGAWVELGLGDWLEIYKIIESSRLVDDVIYLEASKYLAEYKQPQEPLPPLALPEGPVKEFTLSALPATKHPQLLLDFCFADQLTEAQLNKEYASRIYHDLVLYRIGPSIEKTVFIESLKQKFLSQPFIKALIGYIQEKKSLRFGEVNAWIHEHCTDVPLPYRWEVKDSTNTLYNWLDFFLEEIYWDVPGKHSQVIYWEK